VESKITARTVGIIPVHLFGLAAELDAVSDIARRRNLWVVEDAACGFGSLYHGRHVGTFGDIGCFSFHPRKSITTGEGGMATTEDDQLASTMASLRDHGATRSDYDRHQGEGSFLLADYNLLGYNYRLTDLQAAVGSVQMDRADWILGERIRVAGRYDALLGGLDWLSTPLVPDGLRHAYQAYVCLYRPQAPTMDNVESLHQQRNRLMASLEADGIATRPGTHAAFAQGYYTQKYGLRPSDFPNAFMAERLSLALPLYATMTDDDVAYVGERLVALGDGL
jgi:dTDP-4-amino-4,6-dideoxygalactose transaminase